MKIALIGKKFIKKETLPRNSIEDYWIVDEKKEYDNKLLKIKIENNNYEIISSEYSKILDKNCIKDDSLSLNDRFPNENQNNITEKENLKEYEEYPIFINRTEEKYILYCMPDFEENFTHLEINDISEITIGSAENNTIVYNNQFVKSNHAKLYKFKGKWTIENYDTEYGLFVNDFPVYENTKNIFYGDTIFIMGLKIVIIKDQIYINNPNNTVNYKQECFRKSNIEEKINSESEKIKKNENIEINKKGKKEYFSRSPKMVPPIEIEKITIDEPPQMTEEYRKKPLFLTMGSSIAFGVMMLASFGTTIGGINSGRASIGEIIAGIITGIAMLIAMIIIPILDIRWDEKSNKRYEKKRQQKYKEYIEKKKNKINEIKNKQKEILFENYLSVGECIETINKKSPRLWERTIDDESFLGIRLGIGQVSLKIDLSFPAQDKFTMEADDLASAIDDVINNSKTIDECPVTVSFVKNMVSAIVSKDKEFTRKYLKNIILQLVTFHSPIDLKLVFLMDKENSNDWEYVKMLPHVWSDSKQIRFYANNNNDINEVSNYLTEELNNRLESNNNNEYKSYAQFSPYYLIITDNYKLINNTNFISEFLKLDKNFGFSMLCITDDIYELPNNCRTFIDLRNNPNGLLYENYKKEAKETEFKVEPIYTVFYEKATQKLANIPIKEKKGVGALPNSYSFLEMYNVGNIEQIDIKERWKKNDSTLSLKAPIGIDSNGMTVYLDAHEKFHGPHGLIAGSTGSGKSEFIITYILSLAINYNPNDVQFLLIDYKGGGLAGAFENANMRLPHLVGTITNIDKHGLERSLASIHSELKRREVIFNEARNITNEGTIDIYKYQKLFHDGKVEKPIAHLFIICDEFAELKEQEPDFMDELVSVSRIGRSLGVHLILSTQKPSGIVSDQIRSNSKFAICLKVQDTSDSQDVILRPDAALLKNPGQFYLKVGHNEYFVLGQSGWAGAPYLPSNKPIKRVDMSVEFISDIGFPIKKIDETKKQKFENSKDQLTSILGYICDVAKEENIVTNNLWLADIPENIYVEELRQKYNENSKNEIKAVIGEYDDPTSQSQGLVEFNLSGKNNLIIYGNAVSGKETLLSTLIFDLITNYSSDQVQIYIMDFGTEALKIYKGSPHIGDVVFIEEDSKLVTFFDMIQRIIIERKNILSNYNGDYDLYIKKGNAMPIIAIILNNYEAFNENYEDKFDDLFLTLTRECTRCGIIFIVTSSTTGTMRYRLEANFNKKISLQLTDEDDYTSIFNDLKRKKPAKKFGRGITQIGKEVYEFQTAKVCEAAEYNEYIGKTIEEDKMKNKTIAKHIPTLPNKIEIKDMISYLDGASKVPIGLIKKNLEVYYYDFINKFMTVISAKSIEDAILFANNILEELKTLKNVKINILDAKNTKGKMEKAYKDFEKTIKKDINADTDMFTINIIIGIDEFTSEGAIEEDDLNNLFEKAKESGNSSFILIENTDRLECHTYDSWYTGYIDSSSGIWIGNGADDQTLISRNYAENIENNCGDSFGYVFNQSKPTLIKLIGIEEKNKKYNITRLEGI